MMSLTISVLNLEEPSLEFGPGGEHIDPKVGLGAAGPLSLRFGPAHREHVRLGLVGSEEMLEHAGRWFQRCQRRVGSGSPNQALRRDFPGFQSVFRSSLDMEDMWRFRVPDRELELALAKTSASERFAAVLNLYAVGLRELSGRGLRPDVVVPCLSDDVLHRCWRIETPGLSNWERDALRRRQEGQLMLPGFEEFAAEEDALLHRNFRRALKAQAMAVGLAIQIGTDNLFVDGETNQDPATRAWNVCLALFYKAGGLPWRLKNLAPETCYVGVSFHHLQTHRRHLVFSSLAQAFPTSGEGFALRGGSVPWDRNSSDRTLHLTEEQAVYLALRVVEQYRQRVGGYPLRIVLYKSSAFDADEQSGFAAALAHIPLVEMVNLRPAEFRLVRRGAYPPSRGTIAIANDSVYYLFTNGYFPYWGTYMGAHVPVPYEVAALGDADPVQVCSDVLGLTKLNWNTASAFTGSPIPLRFAREVGSIMSHYAELKGEDVEPDPSYRFYM